MVINDLNQNVIDINILNHWFFICLIIDDLNQIRWFNHDESVNPVDFVLVYCVLIFLRIIF